MAETSQADPMPDKEIKRSTRDHGELRDRLEQWLATKIEGASISELSVPGNGMSSETVLFDATWAADGVEETAPLVVRMDAPADAVPAFPSYDLALQAKVMDLVGRTTDAPVPGVRWFENDTSYLGSEFFVMDRQHGDVPPDVMPYPIESFVLDATDEQRRQLQNRTIEVLAEIHRAPVNSSPGATDSTAFLEFDDAGDTALRRHFNHWVAYERWALSGHETDLVDRARTWLEDHWPTAAENRDPVLSWGDSRIGNVMYREFTPVAVFDWEMAGIAPREMDLGWMCFLHTFFQEITVELGLPGLPDFMVPGDAAERYAEASGVEPVDLDWFLVYAAYRHAAIMVRIFERQIHFGEAEADAGGEAAILHAAALERMIA